MFYHKFMTREQLVSLMIDIIEAIRYWNIWLKSQILEIWLKSLIFKIGYQDYVTWPYLARGHCKTEKSYLNAHKFRFSHLMSTQLTFLESSYENLSNDVSFDSIRWRQHFRTLCCKAT